MLFQNIIDNVPCYPHFLTVKEMDDNTKILAEKYPDIVEVFEAGKSNNGYPIYCLKIGKGSKDAFLYGCPHPNEPVGAMMLEYLSTCLAEDKEFREKLDYTWYIIKCCDPDGTMLNEGWFKGPFTLASYARNFFRPPGLQQVDWSFPIKYKKLNFNNPMHETKALMNVIERAKPTFVYPLHNSGFGGAYWYMSYGKPELNEKLNSVPKVNGVPLSLGEPEAPYSVVLGPAIYKTLSMKDEYDYLEKYSNEDPSKIIKCGTCGLDYAIEIAGDTDVFGLVTEVPYFYDKRINDLAEANVLRKDIILESCEFQEVLYSKIMSNIKKMDGYISKDNIFGAALYDISVGSLQGIEAKRKLVENDDNYLRKAKVSEEFESLYVSKFYILLSLGMLLRTLEYEIAKLSNLENKDNIKMSVFKEIQLEVEDEFKELCNMLEKEMNYSVIPIQKLVRIQLECGLIVALNLNKNAKQ